MEDMRVLLHERTAVAVKVKANVAGAMTPLAGTHVDGHSTSAPSAQYSGKKGAWNSWRI